MDWLHGAGSRMLPRSKPPQSLGDSSAAGAAAAQAPLQDLHGSSSTGAGCRGTSSSFPTDPPFPSLHPCLVPLNAERTNGRERRNPAPATSKDNVLCKVKNTVSWKEGAFLSNTTPKAIPLALGSEVTFLRAQGGCLFTCSWGTG